MISADKSAVARGGKPFAGKRAQKPSYDPIASAAKDLANEVWEESMRIADVLAPSNPSDQEPMSELDTWMVLEEVALRTSPFSGSWDVFPQALHDLYALRKKFLGMDQPRLKDRAKFAETQKRNLPDASISPANPEFAKRMARLRRGS